MMFVILLHEIIISIRFYPYEPSYYNFLVGGSKNVAANHLFDDEYWGTGTKEAMEYINRLGTAPVSVYSFLMRHLTIYYANKNVILFPDHPEYAEYNLVPNSVSWFKDAMYFGKTYETTAYVIKRAGADLFYVFKNTSRMGFRCGNETMTSYGYDTE